MAYQPKPAARRPRNPQTQAQIRRDTWLQMVAPLVLAAVVMLVLLVLVILPVGAGVRGPLAAVALILLIMPALVVGLLAMALLGGLIYVLALGILRLPPYFKIGQDYVALAAARIQGGAKRVSNVVLSMRAGVAAAQRFMVGLRAALTFQRRH
jgi:hypothetical protein